MHLTTERFRLAGIGTHHGAARKPENSVSQIHILYNRINILSQHHYPTLAGTDYS